MISQRSDGIEPRCDELLRRWALGLVIVIAGLDLVGWLLDCPWCTSLGPHWVPMRPVTALCLLLSVTGLVCLEPGAPPRGKPVLALVLALAMMGLGAVSLACYAGEMAAGREWLGGQAPMLNLFLARESTRMSAIAAVLFVVFGIVLLLLRRGRPGAAGAAHVALLPVAVIAYMVVTGYVLRVRYFHEWAHSDMACNSAVAFLALSLAAFCARRDTWLMAVFAGEEAGSLMARRLLPVGLTLPLVIGWLRLTGERQGWFDSELGVALVAVTYAVCFLVFVWLTAGEANRADRSRRGAERRMRESEERFRVLFEQAAVGIKRLDPQERLLEVNNTLCQIMGYPREELLRLTLDDITLPADLAREREQLRRLLAGEIVSYSIEKQCRRKDGAIIWVRATGSLPADTGGNGAWWIAVVEDITERKKAEQALRHTADELARSNEDLEQFAYVSSHDLQEPLRMVTGFMQLLEQKYKGRLDANADKYIGYAVDGAKRMQRLIEDLLVYSRVSTAAKTPEPTDAGQALQQALANLKTSLDETGSRIVVHDLPVVRVDGRQLVQVFQNLIGNAIKFRGANPPVIEVAACPDRDQWLFSVRDNGIGIDAEFCDRIFVIFQRLHTREQYPGTGIGLAICKKIVERHGGRIWVESRVGEGATFCFTLPA